MTKLEKERKLKKELSKLNEKIEATGDESETEGVKAIKEIAKEDALRNEQEVARIHSLLEDKTKFKFDDYKRSLAEVMDQSCFRENFPLGWRYHIAVTEKGLVMILLSPDKRRFTRAFTPSNVPKFDFVAMEKVIESAWVTINSHKPKNGIILPNGAN